MMGSLGRTAARAKAPREVYRVGPGEGDARRVLDSVDTIKIAASQTGSLFSLVEWEESRGWGPPVHVHQREDEAYYVLSGEVTVFVGEERISAPEGTLVYAPRGLPHSLRIDSDRAKALQFVAPGGFESFLIETFPSATEDIDASDEPADLDRIAEAAARYGVTILGPPPGPDGP